MSGDRTPRAAPKEPAGPAGAAGLPLSYRLLLPVLRFFFRHLYTTLAAGYDLVAWASSMGQWGAWQAVALEVLPDGPALELGQGPGHLLVRRRAEGKVTFGIDLSPQMCRLAARRLGRRKLTSSLARADAARLPFPSERFSAVYATFPSDYILAPEVLKESRRVLKPGGPFVIVPSAEITGRALGDRLAAWLYRVTGQSGEPGPAWLNSLAAAGFEIRVERIAQPRALVMRVIARRPSSVWGDTQAGG